MKKQPLRTHLEVTVDLPWPAFLPRDYMPARSKKSRCTAGWRGCAIGSPGGFSRRTARSLRCAAGSGGVAAAVGGLRLLAARWQIATVHLESQAASDQQDVVLGYRNRKRLDKLALRSGGRLRIVDDHSAYFRLALRGNGRRWSCTPSSKTSCVCRTHRYKPGPRNL